MRPEPFVSLMYHDFAESPLGSYTIGWHALREQLDRLRAEGFVVEGFGGLERRLADGNWPARYVVLSLDDGYRTFLKAAEWLAERDMRATFFLTRDFCRERAEFLKEPEIRTLGELGEVGTHGTSHLPLNWLSSARAHGELADSKRWLEDLIGKEVRFMSAPGGYWNQGCQRLAADVGYSLVGTSREWWNRPERVARDRQVNRVTIRPYFGQQMFDRILKRDGRSFLLRRLRSLALALPNAVRGRWDLRQRTNSPSDDRHLDRSDRMVHTPTTRGLPLKHAHDPGVMGLGSHLHPGSPITPALKVWYVFSRFPAPSETFAGNDVRALRELGMVVRAVNLRPSLPCAPDLLREWELDGLELDEVTLGKLAAGLAAMLRRPDLLAFALGTIFRDNWRSPVHVGKSLLVLPRIFQIQRALSVGPPDVVHLFWGHYSALLGLLIRRTHPRVVLSVFLGAYDLRSRYRTSATLARCADGVFTHARANLPLLDRQGIPTHRVQVVYRGADLERMRYRSEAKVPFRIASAGRLTPEKGMHEVIEVFARIRKKWPRASLCVVGYGPERPALERRVRELNLSGVQFTGRLTHRQVFARLCEAEVFLFLSHEEHLPNVVKEAIAARCACVVSRTTGIEELVSPGERGLVVEARDVAAAAAGVSRMFEEPGLRDQFTERAWTHLEAHFDVKRSMRRYCEVWQACYVARRTAPSEAPVLAAGA